MELTRRQMLRASLGALAATSCGYVVATPTPATPKTKLQLHAMYADVPLFTRMATCNACKHTVPLAKLPHVRIVGVNLPKASRAIVLVSGSRCANCSMRAWEHSLAADHVMPLAIPISTVSMYTLHDEPTGGTRTLRFHPRDVERHVDPLSRNAWWHWKGTPDLRSAAWRADKYTLEHLPFDMLVAVLCGTTLLLTGPLRAFYALGPAV